jgi:tRNA-specific 2-thiouridylase
MQDDRGRRLGEHVGLSFYTLGQRQGLGIGGVKDADAPADPSKSEHAPWYVARKDMAKNTLLVVQGHDHPWLQSHSLEADDLHWVSGHAPAPGPLQAKTRYRQHDAACAVTYPSGGHAGQASEPLRMDLRFEDAQWAVTPGQSAVLYDGEVCLGGGVIGSASS